MIEEVETVLALMVFEPMYGNTKQVGQKVGQGLAETFHARGRAVTERARRVIHQGYARRIVVRNDAGHPVLDIPVTAGFIALIAAPTVTTVAAVAALANKRSIEVERDSTVSVRRASHPEVDEELR